MTNVDGQMWTAFAVAAYCSC